MLLSACEGERDDGGFLIDVDLIMLIETAVKPFQYSRIMGPANTGVLHCGRLMFNLSGFVRKGKYKVMVNQQKALFLEDLKRTLHFDSSYNPIQGCRTPHMLSRAQALFIAVMPAQMGEDEARTRGFRPATGVGILHRVPFI